MPSSRCEKNNLFMNLRTELEYLARIRPDDITVQSFLTQMTAHAAVVAVRGISQSVYVDCLRIQERINVLGDTEITIPELGYRHTFPGTGMFTALWHTLGSSGITTNGIMTHASFAQCTDHVSSDLLPLGPFAADKKFNLTYTVI